MLFTIVIIISFKIVSSFLMAIIVGALLAHLSKPLQNMMIAKKINPKLSAYLLMIFLLIMMIVPLFFFIQKLIVETGKFAHLISSSQLSFESVANYLKSWPILSYLISDPVSFDEELRSSAKIITETVSGIVLNLAAQIPSLIIDAIFILLSFLVFLLNGDKIKLYISNLIPLDDYIKKSLLTSSNEISRVAILASFLAASGQSIIILFGFLALNIPNAFLASGATFILSFIPFVGSLPVWAAGVIYLLFKGSVLKIVLMIIIGVITSLIDNVIRALVLKSSNDQLHPLLGLISVVGGIQVFGPLGVLIGPLVAALFLSMCQVWMDVLMKKDK